MFSKVLIANRGAIACRIIRTLERLGVGSVAVYSEADTHSLHVAQATEAVLLGPAPAAQSYLDVDKVLAAAQQTGAQAIHPGYGFLSENASFAEACAEASITFIGPTPAQLRLFGLKHLARDLALRTGVPLLPGTGLLTSEEEAVTKANEIGYPVMLKSTAGGGGIGMRLCRNDADLRAAYEAVERLGRTHFKDGGLYVEKFIEQARHIEVQVFGDGRGTVVALGERDCSVQRRNQKVIEETPAPGITARTRRQLLDTAVTLMRAADYQSAGTVEYVYDAASGEFYFLEVNTRLQVEHGVTEEVTGVDLVEWMVRQAAGELGPLEALAPAPTGASIQVRLYAENPAKNFQPDSGLLTRVDFPHDLRCDTWVEAGAEVTPYYDPLLAKIIAKGSDRAAALQALQEALTTTRVDGIATNLEYLRAVVSDARFAAGGVTTRYLDTFAFAPCAINVIDAGTMTTVQDYPGRLGYWDVGVPPSGPMDALAFRFGNRLLGNGVDASGLECTLTGPTLEFHAATTIAITGANMQPRINGLPVDMWTPLSVAAGDRLEMGSIEGPGARAFVLAGGGFDTPLYLNSVSTFTLGRFGGHGGRALRTGDMIPLKQPGPASTLAPLPGSLVPQYTSAWSIGVMYGPHGAPDFFTDADIEALFATSWKVHYNSSRTGVRLIGPKPRWARQDGGEAGLHPSNIHDNAYAIGTIDYTGDMPVILGPDGPSLGGFVCPATIVSAELWKIGQLKPGDTIRFVCLTAAQAAEMESALEVAIDSLAGSLPALPAPAHVPAEPAIVHRNAASVYRTSGDKYLLVEYGDAVLDLNLRFHVHALMTEFAAQRHEGIIDLTPGIRSLQVHYDSRVLSRDRLLRHLDEATSRIPNVDDMVVPTRIVHLPLSWDDPATRLAIERYMGSVRADAPWCPSNIDFIRRINGLASMEDVRKIVFDASYLVLGLGDVYLGAPVATPIDPRHRLVTTKYNPARTWTPENAVGIGGAYLCVYGMEGPGGYQFVGRTVQMWNTYRTTADFPPGNPWLLRFFDQLRFYPVGADELLDLRDQFLHGQFRLRVTSEEFRLRDYQAFLQSIQSDAAAFKAHQQEAFHAERERWAAAGANADEIEDIDPFATPKESPVPPGCLAVAAPTTASVWRIEVSPGDDVQAGQRLLILEAMKMEIAVVAPRPGRVHSVLCRTGSPVTAGQHLIVMESEPA